MDLVTLKQVRAKRLLFMIACSSTVSCETGAILLNQRRNALPKIFE